MIILADEDLPVGCLTIVRLQDVMEAELTEDGKIIRNDRLVAWVAQSRAYANVAHLAMLGQAFVDELSRFFAALSDLKEKHFEVKAIGNPDRACVPYRKRTDMMTAPGEFVDGQVGAHRLPGSSLTGSHLERYASRLNAVEINSSFYHPRRRATYKRWAASVPDGFTLPSNCQKPSRMSGVCAIATTFFSVSLKRCSAFRAKLDITSTDTGHISRSSPQLKSPALRCLPDPLSKIIPRPCTPWPKRRQP